MADRKPNVRPLLLIIWEDHSGFSRSKWRAVSEIVELRPELVCSIGWLLREDDKSVVLASHGYGDEFCGEMCIVKGAILKRWMIADPSKKIGPLNL